MAFLDADAVVFFLDTLLSEDEKSISQHFNMDTKEELFAAVGPLLTRQHHSRPPLYSEQWIDRYVDEDFKMNFRLSRQQFEVVLTTIERFKFLQYAIKSCFRKYFRLGPMTLLLNVKEYPTEYKNSILEEIRSTRVFCCNKKAMDSKHAQCIEEQVLTYSQPMQSLNVKKILSHF